MSKPKFTPMETRLLRHANPPDENGCILWTGCINENGYGLIGTEPGSARKLVQTHRATWELHNGPIPDGLCVLHRCDIRNCIAIEHLFLGTQQDNATDMTVKGRSLRGERNHIAKLTQEQVQQIRDRHASGGTSLRKLAREYGVDHTNVSMIIRRKTWKHI